MEMNKTLSNSRLHTDVDGNQINSFKPYWFNPLQEGWPDDATEYELTISRRTGVSVLQLRQEMAIINGD